MKKGFICDMDGVIYHGNQILPGVPEFIQLIKDSKLLSYLSLFMATYECPSCKLTENPYFIKDNDAKPLVPHSYVSASLATHVMYSKFINAMPYHRQEKGIII